ncbi:MAG: hypothetical protein ACXWBN_01140 [Acidimicrobiales bacterium]
MSEPEGIEDGVEHLQAAANEMIAAGRAFLDAVEDVVRDRDAVASVVDAFSSIAHAATQAASQAATQASRVATGRDRPPGSSRGDDDPPSRVQHIRVS